MSEENKQDVVETTTPEGENQDELNSILEALGEKDGATVEGDKTQKPSEDKDDNKDGEKPFKKVGNHIFKTEADYDTWALKNYGEVSRLSGELAKAQEAHKNNPSEKTKTDVNAIRMQIKVADFFEANPKATEYKDVIAGLLRSGKASSLDDAYNKTLKALGEEPEKKESTEDLKNFLKAGGGDQNARGGDISYKSNDEVKNTSDFADGALLGKF
ncbi:MAG TPA: hypothetical protein PKN54_04460 [Candidatus Cloacimonas acidaminovorans]|nr:hypothetical protein [Candidatus Cloacimonas acidaminovorans]